MREFEYNSTLRMLTDRALQIAQEQVKQRYDGSHLLGGMSTEAEAARTAFLDAAAAARAQERASLHRAGAATSGRCR